MKRHIFIRIFSMILVFAMLSSDLSAYAAIMIEGEVPSQETVVTEEQQESSEAIPSEPVVEETAPEIPVPEAATPEAIVPVEPVTYQPYWELANLSNLIVFVEFADTLQEHYYAPESVLPFQEAQQQLHKISYGNLKMENLIPQYSEKENQIIALRLDKTAKEYAEDEQSLLEEVVQKVNDTFLLLEGMVLDYGNQEALLDHLTIVVPCEENQTNTLFNSHSGIYSGQVTLDEKSIHTYSVLTEAVLCFEGHAQEVITECALEGLGYHAPFGLEKTSMPLADFLLEKKWIEIPIVTNNQTAYELLETAFLTAETKNRQAVILKKADSDMEYFVIEYRKERSDLLVYRVNTQIAYDSENEDQRIQVFSSKEPWTYSDGTDSQLKVQNVVCNETTALFDIVFTELPENEVIPEEPKPQEPPVEEAPSVSAGVQTGVQQIGSHFYLFNSEGKLLKGYVQYEGNKYYSDKNGILKSGWIKLGSEWRYFDEAGSFAEIAATSKDGLLYTLANGNVSYFTNKTTLLKNKWQNHDGSQYYFDQNGMAVKGWYQDGSNWYYADENGKMADHATVIGGKTYFFDTSYHLSTGWKKIDGIYRYFNIDENQENCYEIQSSGTTGWVTLEDGRCAYLDASGPWKGWKNANGCRFFFDSEGFVTTGWFQEGRYIYYGEPKETATAESPVGNVAKGVKKIGNEIYGFHQTKYYRMTGWQQLEGNKYFFQEDCTAVKGWYQEGAHWYHADENGCMQKGLAKIKDLSGTEHTYYFNQNYWLQTGWIRVDNQWRYFDQQEDHLQCFELETVITDQWINLPDGRKSYVNASNNLLKGWQTVEGKRYYFDDSGILQTGWFQVGSHKYYGELQASEGAVSSGMKWILGKLYYFHPSQYYMLTGWQTVNGQRYFIREDGTAVVHDWYQEGDYWYYADAEGCMQKGLARINDPQGTERAYYFDNNYRLSTGWKLLTNEQNEKEYVFFDWVAEEPWECCEVTYSKDGNGWLTLADGRKSYVNNRNQILKGWQTIEGKRYYFDAEGIMKTGEFQVGRYYYYAHTKATATAEWPEGRVASGARVIDGKVYGFHPTQYYRMTGWQTIDGNRYYLQDDCSAVVNDWYQDGSFWYHADENGCMQKGLAKIRDLSGAEYTYYFDQNYRLQTGWIRVDNQWRYFAKQTDPAQCFEIEYTVENGWVTLPDVGRSYINSRNQLLKSWQNIDGHRYYFDSDGLLLTGMFQVGNQWYYGEPKGQNNLGEVIPQGALAKGIKEIGADTYVFHNGGYQRLSGWQTVNGKRFYLNKDGIAETGLFEVSGRKYYGEEQTVIDSVTGVKTVKGTLITGARKLMEATGTVIRVFHPIQHYMLNGWQTVNGQRYFIREDGTAVVHDWYQEGDYWYYADADGCMQKGLARINDPQGIERAYYFDNNYRLSSGWKLLTNEQNEKAYVFFDWVAEEPWKCCEVTYTKDENGWLTLADGRKSYVNSKNQILKGWQTIEGKRYYFDADGIMKTGEFQVGRYHYYAMPTGELASGAVFINGNVYGFHQTQYYRMTGWQTIEGNCYYFGNDGIAVIGWYQEGDYWYYADEKGRMQRGEYKTSESQTYYFDGNYRLKTGWIRVESEWKYFKQGATGKDCYLLNGVKENGWITLSDGKKGYVNRNNSLLKGWQTIEGSRYYFGTDGIMETSWFEVSGQWYYADADGTVRRDFVTLSFAQGDRTYYFDSAYRLKTGWVTIDGVRYHFSKDERPENCYQDYMGTVSKGWFTFHGKKSYFNSSLNPVTGWQTIEGKRYHFDTDGVLHTQWFQLGDHWYYAGEDGVVVTGVQKIEVKGIVKTYYFDESYRLKTGWQTIDGKRYFLEITDTPENYRVISIEEGETNWQKLSDGRVFYTDAFGNVKKGWQTIDKNQYYFDQEGFLKTGWFTVSKKHYYADENGIVAKGATTIGRDIYVFHSSQYYLLSGFQSCGGKRYYLEKDGKAKTGWFYVGSDRYYGKEDGALAFGAHYIASEGETYFFHPTANYRVTGWQTYQGDRYYLDDAGKAKTGWFTVNGKIYYGEPETGNDMRKGTLAKGVKTIDHAIYVFHGSQYYRMTGWQNAGKERYYLEKDGKATTGWFAVGGKTYYAHLDGTIAKGLVNNHYFHPSQYYLLTGWQTIDREHYYFNEQGLMETGWFKVGEYDYYAESNGKLVKGYRALPYASTGEKKYYFFDNNYRLKTGWQTIDRKRYFFENAKDPQECYQTNDGTIISAGWFSLVNGQICYADSRGNVKTGWQTIDRQRYYFDGNGVLQTGWFTVGNRTYYGEPQAQSGAVAKGVKVIDGATYCFHPSQYYLLTGWQTVEGKRYYLDETGKAETGWLNKNGKVYYAQKDGEIVRGAVTIENATYFFHSSQYYRLTGFQSYGGKRYYLEKDGKAKTGWFHVGTDLYYSETDGVLVSGAKEIDGETYFFHPTSNYRLTGWQTESGNRYYLDDAGKAKTDWFTVNGKIYYGEPKTVGNTLKGTLAKGAKSIGSETYVFHGSQYYRLTGWQTANHERYYLEKDGKAKTGWFTLSGKTYYGEADGRLVNGNKVLEGSSYCFHPNQYYLLTGWQTVNGQRYYLDDTGKAKTGWFTLSGKTYYADAEGALAKGTLIVEGKTYFFHSSQYYLMTGFQSYGGNRYYLDKSGKAQTGWFYVGSDCYYGEADGRLASGAKEIDGATYFFHLTSNYRLTGWQMQNGQKYFLQQNGQAKTGWFTLQGKTYYGEPECDLLHGRLKGSLVNGAREIAGETYCFHNRDFYRLTGWQTVNTIHYYLQADGKARSGWFTQGGVWYYGAEAKESDLLLKGSMKKDLRVIGEKTYCFDANYQLFRGWKVLGGIRHFFEIAQRPEECFQIYEGPISNGWFTFTDGRKSYFNSQGNPVSGWQTIQGKRYYFDFYGIMQTGWCTIDGKEYFFNKDGIYIPLTAPNFVSLTSDGYGTANARWNRIDGVQSYVLEYSKNNAFPDLETTVVDITDSAITEQRITNLEPGATYYFRLKYTAWGKVEDDQEMFHSQYSGVKSLVIGGEVAPTANAATMVECEIVSGTRDTGMTVQIHAILKDRIQSADQNYYIVETESYGNSIDRREPVGVVEKAFDIAATVEIGAGTEDVTARDGVNRALMNKFALAILKEDGSYQLISAPMGITNPEFVSENTAPILKPMSKKGLQGIDHAGALNTNSKNTLFNLDLASVVGSGPRSGYVEYVYKGKTYYFSDCSNLVGEFRKLDEGVKQYIQEDTGKYNKVAVTLNLLLSYKSSNAYLIDPAARTPGHRYYTMNVREERARETYEAVFCYLGELFGQGQCYVTHWVLGNEVNSSRAWNYQGSLSFNDYMKTYAATFRLLYNGVKAAKTGNNVYISLDNGWMAAPDTHAGKPTLDTFAAYAQKENPDMLWSIAYHGYSYPLTRCDFWNDYSNTTDGIGTPYISMRNINVLTNYVADLEKKYEKPSGSIRVILSEQGYNAGQGHEIQAQAIARGYYIAEFNDRIDAFIIRAIIDDRNETSGGLYLGLQNLYQEKRISFYTYEFMDSDLDRFSAKNPEEIASTANLKKVEAAQRILGKTNWAAAIPHFDKNKLAGMY